MTSRLVAFVTDAHDPAALAAFWGGFFGWEPVDDPYAAPGAAALRPHDDTGFLLRFVPGDPAATVPHQYHYDVTSRSWEDQAAQVDRALALGGRHLDVGQLPEEQHVVLADPEGNPFCVVEPVNGFLAGCPHIGALSGDGSQACGYFWSEALGWPLVWDQDEETAIQAPTGGPKISWGGPPLQTRAGKERVHLDLAPTDGSTQAAEVERLLSLGATRADIGQGDVPWVVLADPDGHELCVMPA